MNNSCVIWNHRLLLNLSTSLAQVCPSWLSEGEIRPADCNLAAVGCSWSQETVGFASHSWCLIVYQGLTGTKHTCYWYFVFVFVFVLDICHVCTHAWMTRTNHRSVMERLLHNTCIHAATSGSSALENNCSWSALPSNMAAEPYGALPWIAAALVVACVALLPGEQQGRHHHQFDDVEMALLTMSQASHYALEEPNHDRSAWTLNGWNYEAKETYDYVGFVSGVNLEAEAMVIYQDYQEFLLEACGCSWNAQCCAAG